MSGIYLLGVIAIWLWLTRLLWKTGRRFLDASFANRPTRLMLVAVIGALWFGGSFWEAGGKKLYWDARVRELCAKDGGVRVYETVELPAELYDQYARGNWMLPDKAGAKSTDEYYVERDVLYFRQNRPSLLRRKSQIIRRIDGKVLGVYIHYGRGGGDLPGPWHGSSFSCPDPATVKFETSIFVRGDN